MLIFLILRLCILVYWTAKLSFHTQLKLEFYMWVIFKLHLLCLFFQNRIFDNYFHVDISDPFKKDECSPRRQLWRASSVHWWFQWSAAEGCMCWGWHVGSTSWCHWGLFSSKFLTTNLNTPESFNKILGWHFCLELFFFISYKHEKILWSVYSASINCSLSFGSGLSD